MTAGSSRWSRRVAAIGAIALLAACDAQQVERARQRILGTTLESPRRIVVDSWWSADMARGTCANATEWLKSNRESIALLGCDILASCPELKPVAEACALRDPGADWADFEDEMATAFATDASCKGIALFNFAGPGKASRETAAAMAGPHWFLMVNFVPGHTNQEWTMVQSHFRTSLSTKGQGPPAAVAHTLCEIVNERGGSLQ